MEENKLLDSVKRKLNITWEDNYTELKVKDIIEDAKIALNHKLGSDIDYSKPGMERNLFMNYCLYSWNDCLDEFDKKYMNEIYQIRAIYEVKQYAEKKNQSILKFGRYVEKYDNNEILLDEKEFIQEGKLFFSYKTIREQDRLKFDDTGYKIELKINTPYMNKIKSDHIVLIDDNVYSIKYIEPDFTKKNLYMFLSNYEDEMDTYISIYKANRISPIANPTLNIFKNAWCKVENILDKSTREKTSNDISKIIVQKKITLKYIKELDSSISKDILSKYKIGINGVKYKIISSLNINNENKLIQLEIEKES